MAPPSAVGWPSKDPEDYRRRNRAPRPDAEPSAPGERALPALATTVLTGAGVLLADLGAVLGLARASGDGRAALRLRPPSKNPDDYRWGRNER